MRITVSVEDDLMIALRRRAEQDDISLTCALDSVLRAGLRSTSDDTGPREPFVQRTARLGPAFVNLDKALTRASELEDQAITERLAAGK